MIADADLQAARAAGLNDAEIIEVVQHVALNILTNYTNNVAQTVIDFPEVKPGKLEPEPAPPKAADAATNTRIRIRNHRNNHIHEN